MKIENEYWILDYISSEYFSNMSLHFESDYKTKSSYGIKRRTTPDWTGLRRIGAQREGLPDISNGFQNENGGTRNYEMILNKTTSQEHLLHFPAS